MISPTLRKLHTETEVTEDGAEARMRQALGQLGSAKLGKPDAPRRSTTYQATPGAGRHRFKQDGEVPVVRISLAQGCRATERQAQALVGSTRTRQGPLDEGREHGNGETARQVQELTEQLRVTQTRLGHAELALTEADRKAETRQEEAASLRQALDGAEATLTQLRARLATSEQVREELERRWQTVCSPSLEAKAREELPARRKVGRPLGSTKRVFDQVVVREPEPVKWWAGD